MKLKTSGKWRSVELDPHLQAKGFAEGLLGIEELPSSNYNIIGNKSKKSKDVPEDVINDTSDIDEGGKYVRKRPSLPEDDEPVPPKKKKKTRQKRKPKDKTQPKNQKQDKRLINNKANETREEQGESSKIENEGSSSMSEISLPAWEGLSIHNCLLKALSDKGFTCPTPIQKQVIPAAIGERVDIVAAAETGSGKTLAFGIPILNGILKGKEKNCIEKEIEDTSQIELLENDELDKERDSNESSDEHEDMSDSEGITTGCVKVVNNVEFDFDVDLMEAQSTISKQTDAVKPIRKNKLQALVLTPTRELAIQVKDHLVAAAKYTDIQVAVVVGGMAPQKQTRMLRRCPEIVVATPGRLWDLIEQGDPHLNQVSNIRYLAIDETDRMLEKGHFDELQKLLEMMKTKRSVNLNGKRQNFVLSATLSLVHDLPKHLLHKRNKKAMTSQEKLKEIMEMIGVRPNPKIVDITRKTATAETLVESQIRCTLSEKDHYLYYFFVEHPGRTLVFCNSIDCVRRLVNLFQLLDCEPLGLHAQMQQRQRLKNLDRFISNPTAILIATDVAARGLDIKDVQHVVHYQVPRTAEGYVHRSGRTARAQKEGLSVILIEPGENIMYKKTCHTLKRNDELPSFPIENTIFPSVKKRVQLARELDKLLLVSKKEEMDKSWWKKAAEEADLEFSEGSDDDADKIKDEMASHTKLKETSKRKSNIERVRFELRQLLAIPVTQQGFSGKYPTMTGQLQLPSDFKSSKHASAITKLTEEANERKIRTKNSKSETSKTRILQRQRNRRKKKSNSSHAE